MIITMGIIPSTQCKKTYKQAQPKSRLQMQIQTHFSTDLKWSNSIDGLHFKIMEASGS